jgi:hypothetical protein
MTPTQSEGSPGVMLTKTPSRCADRRLELQDVRPGRHVAVSQHTTRLAGAASERTKATVEARNEAYRTGERLEYDLNWSPRRRGFTMDVARRVGRGDEGAS